MQDDLMIFGLLRRRAEMAGEIDALREQLGVLLNGLDHVDATIRIFKPDIDLDDLPARPIPPPSAAFRGEVQRFLLHTLKHAAQPMTTHELAKAIMEQRRLNVADRVLLKLISQRTGHSLAKLRRAGLVRSERFSTGALLRWQVTREALGGNT